MKCPLCGNIDDRVLESRQNSSGTRLRRRRECLHCKYRFTSYEIIEELPLMVIKQDGRRQEFDYKKLERGVIRSLEKCPIPRCEIDKLSQYVEDQATHRSKGNNEIYSKELGEILLDKLYHLDRVAYVRFASVYKRFKNVDEFITMIHDLDKSKKDEEDLNEQRIVLAGGCFWCMESPFRTLEGVSKVLSGYTGGEQETATYTQISKGETGHYEVVDVYYDSDTVTLSQILDVYWRQIDPTDNEGQFEDRGNQYRPCIFYTDPSQKDIIEKSKKHWDSKGIFQKPIVTPILPLKKFYSAEEYHQRYYEKHPEKEAYHSKYSLRSQFQKKMGFIKV